MASPAKPTNSPSKHANSPSKPANSPSKHANSPSKPANSPSKHANSPSKHANSPSKPANSPSKHATSPPQAVTSSKPSYSSAQIETIGSVFLPSHAAILEIGQIMSKGGTHSKVLELDIYSDTPDVLLANKLPTIKPKNMFLVWTPRGAKGSESVRTVKDPKGGFWEAHGGLVPIEDDSGALVGYFRILRFWVGGEGDRDGDITGWYMKEFLVSEKAEDDQMICTIVFKDLEIEENLNALEKASKFLTEKALAPRGIKLVTTRSVAKGKKGSVKAKGSVSDGSLKGKVSVSDGSLKGKGSVSDGSVKDKGSVSDGSVKGEGSVSDGSIIEGSEGASIAMATRSHKIAGTSGSISTTEVNVRFEDTSIAAFTRSRSKRATKGSTSITDVEKQNSTCGTRKNKAKKKVGLEVLGVGSLNAAVVQLPDPAAPLQNPAAAPRVGTDAVSALGRRLGVSVEHLESMSDEDYYGMSQALL